MQRGNNRLPVFLATEEFVVYRELLRQASGIAGCAIHAYVLMTNHVHLLATPAEAGSAARLMKELSQSYARWFNQRHRRTGTLWEGRYRSAVVETERYLFACYRYVESNPVRARMVASPAEYPWSSHRANACGTPDPVVTPHPRFTALDASPEGRENAYRALFATPLDDAVLTSLRRATRTRTVVGTESFVGPLARRLRRRLPPMPQGGDRRSDAFRDL